ncbi:MAG: phosphoribosylformylglycinamidine synthase subunit PurS [Actinomycetota bacterium]
MTNFNAQVHVTLRAGIADPQGQTIERALPALGYEGVSGVRVGKLIEFELNASDADEAESQVGEMCERLLANTVIESYEVSISGGRSADHTKEAT